MKRVFRKAKMLARLEEEGRMNLVGPAELAMMDALDGEEGTDYNWENVVNGENLVWIEATDKHDGAYVAACDCD